MLAADHVVLLAAVREAGALGLRMASENVKRWAKPDGSTVTEADLAIDALLKDRLMTARPSYAWLSEETPDDLVRLKNNTMWIVDPIDGTSAFAAGRDEWCVTAALIMDGRPVSAVVYRPVLDVLYQATAGNGAWRNDVRCRVADAPSLSGARIIGTKKSLHNLPAHGVNPVTNLNIPLLLRLAMVASGEIDGAISAGYKNDWDLAAGELLVNEAGGRVTDSAGKTMLFNQVSPEQNGMVAAGPHRHKTILEQLALS